MKKIALVFAFLLIAPPQIISQWYWQNPSPTGSAIIDVKFISSTIGWAVGTEGKILKTTDGGTSWVHQLSGTTIGLSSVFFTDEFNGTAVGGTGESSGSLGVSVILRTTNGGINWIEQSFPATNDLRDVSFTDSNHGIVVGYNYNFQAVMLRTIDGGINWTQQSIGINERLYGVSFTNVNNGTTVGSGGTILRTTNGGIDWTIQFSGTTKFLYAVSFLDENNGTAVGEFGTVLRTTNGGTTWDSLWVGTTNYLYDVSFTDVTTGIIVASGGVIIKTTNNGATWNSRPSGTQQWLYGICFTDISSCIVVGSGGIILNTTDTGTSWISLQTTATTYPLRATSFIDTNNGWAVGDGGTILRTTNGGSAWVLQTSGTNQELKSVSFIDSNYGTAVGWAGIILRTTNGGTNWISQTSTTVETLYGVSFPDVNNGTAVGVTGTILNTTNGGFTWTSQVSGTLSRLNSVFFVNSNTGWVVGNEGTILKTTNSGVTWNSLWGGTTDQLLAVCFTDLDNGTIVSNGGLILNTTDGGVTWNSLWGGTTKDLFAVSFSDVNNGCAVGFSGTIIRTTDGGANWISQSSGTPNRLYGVCLTNANTGWAVGDGGTILKYYGSASTITLNSPNGGEWWKTGWTKDIIWSSENVSTVNLYYTTNDGDTWNNIATNLPASSEVYEWEIPHLDDFISPSCKIKVENAANNSNYDISENKFIIWHSLSVEKNCFPGQQVVDFLETNVDISLNITIGGNLTVTYYPGEAAILGTLPSGIAIIGDYYWQITTLDVSFNNGKIIVPIATLRGVTDASKLVWLKRTDPGDSWENIGGIISGDYLESDVSFNSFSEFTIGSTDSSNPLPVELLTFTASLNNDEVSLMWETATEVNNYGFEIQRKTEGDWHKIGFINGNGNSNSSQEYSFTDNKLVGGSSFNYRLKQIDNDGQFEYSDIIEVINVPTEFALFQNCPNPFNPSTKIRYQLPQESNVVIQIYNILGSKVIELVNEKKEAGVYEVEFNADNLSSGTYIYIISTDNFVQTKKMILLK